MTIRTVATGSALALCLAGSAWAQTATQPKQVPAQAPNAKVTTQTAPAKTLTIGDKAPAIDIAHWVKGKPVTQFEDDKVYVVEFWATWCGPCKASMPHVSQLQNEYKDYGVTFIGVSDEPLETVVGFLCKTDTASSKLWYEKVEYTLTTDPDKSVKADYFTAAGERGIPSAFIVGKDQRIEWIGHPMSIDEALRGVVNDNWDRAAFKKTWDESKAAEREMASVQQKLGAAMQGGDWPAALAIVDGLLEKRPNDLNLQMQKFQMLLVNMDQPQPAYEVARKVMTANWDNTGLLNAIAWTIVDQPGIKTRDFDVALKAATRANELTESKDPAILDTLARVYWEQGDKTNAIKFQELAVEYAGENPMGAGIREALTKYRGGSNK